METVLKQLRSLDSKNATAQEIRDFYNEATEDYSFWSKDFNMHFGYCTMGKTLPFLRNSMLNEMNRQVLKRLALDKGTQLTADLGCGMGGTMRHFMKTHKKLSIIGVTLSEFQVVQGNKFLNNTKGIIINENYTNTSIPTSSIDGAVAMESFCHSGHSISCLKEAHRILKKGKKLVITDAFLKKPPSELCTGSKYSYDGLCKGWSLDGIGVIDEVKKNLNNLGFKNIIIEDISLRVAPSVLHVPIAIPLFLIKQFFKGKKIKPQSWNNLKASFFALLAGLHRSAFGYYIITAQK